MPFNLIQQVEDSPSSTYASNRMNLLQLCLSFFILSQK